MNRQDVAYFVNSTPKYFYLLPLHFTLVKRYASKMNWPKFMVTETPKDPIIQDLSKNFNIHIVPLEQNERFFLESRLAATEKLPSEIKYLFPIQEDFLLAGAINEQAIEEALKLMDENPDIISIRLMPCPGPKHDAPYYNSSQYKILNTDFMFSYQATLWRREAYSLLMKVLIETPETVYHLSIPGNLKDENERKKFIQVDYNVAENIFGQFKFKELFGSKTHLTWPRVHQHPNAVMLSPWPYRPTAVEKGKIQEWVYEFSKREGFPLSQR